MKSKFFVSVIFSILISLKLFAQSFITEKNEANSFPLITASQTTLIFVDSNDDWLVYKALSLLQNDIEIVRGRKLELISSLPSLAQNIIILGTSDRSSRINKLIIEKKLNVDSTKGKGQAFNWVSNNIIIKTTNHSINKEGKHTIKYWMISPAVILQKMVLDFGGLKPSYLGPMETIYKSQNK